MKNVESFFAENIKKRRHELGLTQKQLAERMGYSEKTVSKWESGIAIAPSSVLPILSKALNTSIDALFDRKEEPEYYLGIDGGGTKTDFALSDIRGNILNIVSLGTCNPVDKGMENTLNVLEEGIRMVCEEVPYSQISAYAGIAGGGTVGNNAEIIGKFLEKFRFARVGNGSDAANAIAAGLGRRNGIAVIMGTGSVAFTQKNRELIKTGGFGYLLEEGGSGFAIGRDGIRVALKAEEGSGTETLLQTLILQKCTTPTILDNLSEFYNAGKRGFASYAPLVFEAYDQGDQVAGEILRTNMKIVAELIEAAGRHLPAEDVVEVVLAGGIANRTDVVISMIKEYLQDSRYHISVCDKPMYMGALVLAGISE